MEGWGDWFRGIFWIQYKLSSINEKKQKQKKTEALIMGVNRANL